MNKYLVILFLFITSIINAKTFYVATTGSNNNTGTLAQPWRTINYGANQLSPGDILIVRDGTYNEDVQIDNDGTAVNRITIKSENKWGAQIRNVSYPYVFVSSGDYVSIEDFDVSEGYYQTWCGIVTSGAYTIISGNRVHDILCTDSESHGGAGIDPDGHHTIIRDNQVYNIGWGAAADFLRGSQGIYIKSNYCEAYRNIVWNISGTGICTYHAPVDHNKILNNTIFNCYTQGILIASGEPSGYPVDYCEIRNNIVYGIQYTDSHYGAIGVWGTIGYNNIFSNNLLYNNGMNYTLYGYATPVNDILSDPLFIDYHRDGTGNYGLQPGSPAINAGIDVGLPYNGTAPDIGAFESGSSQVAPAIPSYVNSSIENSSPSVITMTYNLSLANIVPSASAFPVTVNSSARTVTEVTVSGTKVTLTLSSPVIYGDIVTVFYKKPSSNPLQTSAGGQASSLPSALPVKNNVNEVAKAPEIVNTPPSVVVNYIPNIYSGFIGTLNASGSYDPNGDNLTFTWSVPGNISVSAANRLTIDFLAPIVEKSQTYTFTLIVSDGKATQSKIIPVQIIPYHPELEIAEVVSVKASDFQSPNIPYNIIDGNIGTMWSVNGGDQWISLELKNPFNIQHIILGFQPGQNKEFYFDIFGSDDKENWEQIMTRAKSCAFSGDLQVFDFPDSKDEKEFRYMKFVGLGNSLDKWNYISEFRIFGYRHKDLVDYEDQIVKIYPNPAKEIVNIRIDEPAFVPDFIKIVDLTGKHLYDDKVDPDIRQLQIPLDFKHGIYIIQMGTGNIIMFAQKLVVEK